MQKVPLFGVSIQEFYIGRGFKVTENLTDDLLSLGWICKALFPNKVVYVFLGVACVFSKI